MIPIIETERFYLRKFLKEDAQDLFEMDSDPLVLKYIGIQPLKHIEEANKIIERVQGQYEEYGIGRFAIIEKSSNEYMGWSGLKYETMDINNQNGYYDLGYRLKPKHWGKGIATETAKASLSYGFEEMQLQQICAAADVDNLASNKVLQKIGMVLGKPFLFEGIACNWYSLDKRKEKGGNRRS